MLCQVRTAKDEAMLEAIARTRLKERDPEYDTYRYYLRSVERPAGGRTADGISRWVPRGLAR